VRLTYIGHATLLLEIGRTRILTDPNFEPSLGRFLPRVSPPGIAIDQLPPVDAILLTHAHADHLSFWSLDRIQRDAPLYAPPVIARWLRRRGYANAVALAPGETVTVGGDGLRVHAARATHKGARYGVDRWRGEANMYLLESDAESVFFAGDTALMPDTHALAENRLWGAGRELDVALLPIGYAPRWKRASFRRGHLTYEDALTLFERLRARVFVPYHWGTFRHVTSGAYDAIRRLRKALETHHLRAAVRIVEPGDSLDVERTAA